MCSAPSRSHPKSLIYGYQIFTLSFTILSLFRPAWTLLLSLASMSTCYHKSHIHTITFKMLSVYQTLVLLLVFITSCSGSPFDNKRQANATCLTSCAPDALQIDQFTTFSGNADTPPHIMFFVMNPNPGAPGRMLCTATLGSGEGNFNTSSFYSCEVSFDPRFTINGNHADQLQRNQARGSAGNQGNSECSNINFAPTAS